MPPRSAHVCDRDTHDATDGEVLCLQVASFGLGGQLRYRNDTGSTVDEEDDNRPVAATILRNGRDHVLAARQENHLFDRMKGIKRPLVADGRIEPVPIPIDRRCANHQLLRLESGEVLETMSGRWGERRDGEVRGE